MLESIGLELHVSTDFEATSQKLALEVRNEGAGTRRMNLDALATDGFQEGAGRHIYLG
jgi:hypothetical protein